MTGAAQAADLDRVSVMLEGADPRTTLRWALDEYGDDVAMATGFGPEGVTLIDMFCQVTSRPRIFYLDTGFLFSQTDDLRDRLGKRYGIEFERVAPVLSPEQQAAELGHALWSQDPDRCCGIRKVSPLAQRLGGLGAWIASIRRDQTRQRANTRTVEWDEKFGLVKINPLVVWSSDQVWTYIREHDLPYNQLHDQGYPSIGCTHCTRPVSPGEGERAGRWSWTTKTECGLHA